MVIRQPEMLSRMEEMNTHTGIERGLNGGGRSCDWRGWKAQFARPTGLLGRMVGSLMAFWNSGMNEFAVEMLDLQSEDQTLEIGFGPGVTIGMIAERSPRGQVCGIDISDVMVRQASQRNRELIDAGRVELSLASISDIPYEYGRFTRVLAVNNFQFWPDAERNLHEIQRVLQPGGKLVICLRTDRPGFRLAPVFTAGQVEEIAGLVRWTGFRDVSISRGKTGCCVVGTR